MGKLVCLGGASEVGASAYYLELAGMHILLDTGIRFEDPPYPNYHFLEMNVLDGLFELDLIYLSHAHYDHIGSLPYIAKQAIHAEIISTLSTKELTSLQLLSFRNPLKNDRLDERLELELLALMDRINSVSLLREYRYHSLTYKLYYAGHMNGATMIHLKSETESVLYTGDFSDHDYCLTTSYNLPKDLTVDTLILSSTHAFNPRGGLEKDFSSFIHKINQTLLSFHSVVLMKTQLTKGIETIKLLEQAMNMNLLIEADIYFDETLEAIVDTFEQFNYPVYSKRVKPVGTMNHHKPFILITQKPKSKVLEEVRSELPLQWIRGDYSLHCSYDGLKKIIEQLKPKRVYLVHTIVRDQVENLLVDLKQSGIETEIILAVNNKIYQF
jgi:Cft2 family RNA processing exonuclease